MNASLSALMIPIVVVALLMLVVRTMVRPSRPRLDRPVDDPDLDVLDLVASGLSRAEAMQLRARLGEADIWTSMIARRNGYLDVWVFHDDADEANALLNN